MVISTHPEKAVNKIFKNGVRYKHTGVIITGLVSAKNNQLDLFEYQDPKHKPLMSAIDKLNWKYSDNKIKLGNQDLELTWKMR